MAYYTLLTSIGAAKLANAKVTGQTVLLTEIAVGDGQDGEAYDPSEGQTALEHEVWRAGINQIYIHADNANWMVIEGVVPQDSGGWYVREVGIFDADGDLFAIAKYPDTYKPVLTEGSGKDLYIRMILEISNAASVELNIDPAIVLASRKYCDDEIAAHDADPNAHLGNIPHDIGFSAGLGPDGSAQDLAVQRYGRTTVARPMTVTGEVIDMEEAPDGAAAVFDIHANGASLYTTLPQVADGEAAGTAGVLDAATVNLSAGDVVEFFCTEAAGKLASFTLKGHLR